MHFSVLLFHCSSVESMMDKRHYDATEDEGANVEFNEQYSIEEAEKEYKKFIKANPKEKETYPNVGAFMSDYHCCILDEDEEFYGNYSNQDGMYDWYEVGGRWSNLLPEYTNEKQLKKLLDEALNLKNKEVEEKFRDNVELYVKLKEMPLIEACQELKLGTCDSIQISDKIPAKEIIKFWMKEWKQSNPMIVTEYFILEDGPNGEEVINGVDVDMFIDTYNYYIKRNKKQSPMDKFYLTVLDLHT